ncbi:MAG TPA: hypothetical protein VMN37_04980 [Gemmatimonadales bacterium]|nr:hypothetical protein [Gemmatimonadales bacterium]
MRRLLLLACLAAVPGSAEGQSSQFGIRGLGQPGRPFSARATGTAGAFGLFDGESSLNPAALDGTATVTALFTGVQSFRSVENPAGSESLRESRFPLIGVAGPLRRFPVVLGLSYSSYTNRDFTLATTDTLVLRDLPVPVADTLSSRGGISDLRFAGSYRLAPGWAVGAAFHVLTGSSRMAFDRSFDDPDYSPVSQRAELSYAGVGASIGTVRQLTPGLAVAALVRSDGHAGVDRDSVRATEVDLPYTFGLGLRWRLTPRLEMATQGLFRTWSGANSDLLADGAPGAKNTIQVAVGGEYVGDPRRPFRRPLRFGARYGTLPFPILDGPQPREFAAALGTGIHFAQQRAGIDLGLEYFRRTAGEYSEKGLLVTVGVAVRP